MRMLAVITIMACTILYGQSASAWEPDEVLSDQALEARARALSSELRCLVCQNQSIDDSNAELAKDLRVLVRERLVAGESDADIRRFLVKRYGEFILLQPSLSLNTLALWGAPGLLLFAGCIVLLASTRRVQQEKAEKSLSALDKARLAEIVRE